MKAIVLRVDSGGGSAFASEVIRRELAVARQEGKKVVVSMGSVAASGGYWISTASDEIWASPDTITGSIGIFGLFPTIDKPLAKYLGVHVDGVGTTWLSGALRVDRPMKPEVGKMIQLVIDKGYQDFLARVSEARKMTPEEVNRIARGRVWSGADAYERKLVDKLGSLPDAVASARADGEAPEGRARLVRREGEDVQGTADVEALRRPGVSRPGARARARRGGDADAVARDARPRRAAPRDREAPLPERPERRLRLLLLRGERDAPGRSAPAG